ncbi:hypothetical protein AWU67_06070 [Microterricola viridarii]|uniref:AB hydrolase-1 domain-containing protein n=2 Tax=Microterricola viridarii TaxID=412690 RepID=A0A0Y0NZQ1_9MICO|nr:hypothetical protein AWU67_06070 [Microterricola viridarii]
MWHQPAHWSLVQQLLAARGVTVITPTLHRGSLDADIHVVQQRIDACARPPVILGHSYGGSVISGVESAHHLVYVAAFVPDVGESSAALGGSEPLVNAALVRNADGSTFVNPVKARSLLFADCDDAGADWAIVLLRNQAPGHGRGVARLAAWRSVESTYVLCAQDRALDPRVQASMSLRCTDVVRLDSSHSPFVSRPEVLADLLAAMAGERATATPSY